jgi:2-keto-4-pentenoate hydratase/2-oxohepta-3-ene-1,7-dioic acid hydratase in catechol pathway
LPRRHDDAPGDGSFTEALLSCYQVVTPPAFVMQAVQVLPQQYHLCIFAIISWHYLGDNTRRKTPGQRSGNHYRQLPDERNNREDRMKLLRYDDEGRVHLGVAVGNSLVPIDGLGFPTMLSLIESGDAGLARVHDHLATAQPTRALSDVRLLAPIERPGKYLAIGMNYAKHLEESDKLGVARSKHQTWFNKQTTCISGPYDDIDPGVTEKLDYEVELGAVIGTTAKHVSAGGAKNHVFGYFVANDVSARDWQFHTPTFTMGKSFDTHGPIGPWIVTADEVPDPHALALRCYVNGELRQANNTSQMIHNLWEQIAYLSTAFTLEVGDLIATGTPEGVGIGMEPQHFLQPGDVVRCEIDGIGIIENRVVTSV